MSDIVVELRGLEKAARECDMKTISDCANEAAEEIERLRADKAQLAGTIKGMDVGVENLKKRIEELEKQVVLSGWNDFEGDVTGMHIITTEQIRAAWRLWGEATGTFMYVIEDVLAELNIVRCEGCHGTNRPEYPLEGNYGDCPNCDEGWIICEE